jgi:hypothetical protein
MPRAGMLVKFETKSNRVKGLAFHHKVWLNRHTLMYIYICVCVMSRCLLSCIYAPFSRVFVCALFLF